MKDKLLTYCNPIPLPNYPIGRNALLDGRELNWRETADPTVIYEDGKWYLYSSCGMIYYTDDFANWKHIKAEPYDCGYAPTVCRHKGKYLLCASLSNLFEADNPLGPFSDIGEFKLPSGEKLTRCYDPMVFSDDDGRLYMYYSTGQPLIFGCELDSDNPTQLLSNPQVMFAFNPEHIWERCGEYNEDGCISAVEGPWMFKKNGVYYLTYCACGTEYSTYAMGAYKGSSPLGPWDYMKTSPFTKKTDGVVRGPGHGCICEGPNDTLWVFYTTTVCYIDPMERRIGYDPVYINDEGDLVCPCISETPQMAPGIRDNPENGNGAGLVCVSGRRVPYASSSAPGRDAIYATDEDLLSFWQPAEGDERPTLTIPFGYYGFLCSAVRIIWRDVGLSVKNNALPGPIKYTLELRDTDKNGEWKTVLDRSESAEDLIVDYRTFEYTHANEARLTIYGAPENITPAVINISVFGRWDGEGKRTIDVRY